MADVDAAGLLFVCPDDGTALCVRRSAATSEPNVWCPPGGGREAHEDHRTAAEREAQEELGLHSWPRTTRPMGTLRASNGFVTYVDAVSPRWKRRLEGHRFASDEVAEVAWLNLHDLPEALHPGFAEVLDQPVEPMAREADVTGPGYETEVDGRPTGPGVGYNPDRSFDTAYHLSGPNPGIKLRDLQPWDGWGGGIDGVNGESKNEGAQ